MKTNTRIITNLALASVIAVGGVAAASSSAHAGPACSDGNVIIAKAGVATYGTNCADKIYGTSGNDVIYALGGNDEIMSGTGADMVFGGFGDDDIYTGSGVDWIDGESGDDFIMGGTDNDTINGGSGDDILRGEEGNDNMYSYGGAGVNDGNDELYGGDGNDWLNGGEGIDWVDGQSGDDSITSHEVTPAYDHLAGGQGKDKYAVKDAIEHNQANRDDVDKDYFDYTVTDKNAADTFTDQHQSNPAAHLCRCAAGRISLVATID